MGALFMAGPAEAQEATALDRLEPAPAGDALVTVPSAAVNGHLMPSTGVLLSYANKPLSLKLNDADRTALTDVVDYQLTLHVLASLSLAERVLLDVDVPLTLSQGGEDGSIAAQPFAAPNGAAVNDVRTGLRLELLQDPTSGVSASLAFSAWLPSGDEGAYAGTGTTRFAPSVSVGQTTARLAWSAFVSRRFQDDQGAGLLGSEVLFGAGVARRWGAFQVGPELVGGTVVDGSTEAFERTKTNLEALLLGRYFLGPATFTLGAGPGLSSGVGTPDFRLLAGVTLAPGALQTRKAQPRPVARPVPVPDVSGAQRPTEEPDRDGDGVPDATDACPEQRGLATAERPGCPPDKDRDGVFDADDACVDVPGVPSLSREKNGCPSDRDGDTIIDSEDACPDEKGPRVSDTKLNGCPPSVRVEGGQIVIMEQVHFDTGKHEIKPDSFELLGQVVAVMKEHPEIARVSVDGHTDNAGREADNVALSQRRALAVVKYLIEHGVDARRLEARGFGPRRPIADNGSKEGKAKNRRVELQIRKRTDEGEAGWRDGPVD